MAVLQSIWSNGVIFATVGCAVVSAVLMVVCFIAGLCPCEKSEAREMEPAAPALPAEHIDYGWMRAA